MKKTLLLAGVACVLCSTNALAGWNDMVKATKVYVGADYALDSYDFKGNLDEAKKTYNSGIFNMGVRMDRIGVEVFGQWAGKRTKDLAEGEKLKTKVNAYGVDLYGYQPLGLFSEGGNFAIAEDSKGETITYDGQQVYYTPNGNFVVWNENTNKYDNINKEVQAYEKSKGIKALRPTLNKITNTASGYARKTTNATANKSK